MRLDRKLFWSYIKSMADVNTVVIVSDRQELVNQISQKLVLLRNLDKIKSCSVFVRL